MNILETERLVLREMDSAIDAEFVFELLNSPKFLKFIGDRGVRSIEESAVFIDERYRQSYREHGYGLYTVERREDGVAVGVCGFVRRESLSGPDLGFAFLPEFERMGFGRESASAILKYGRDKLGFESVFAITTPDNEASIRLLENLGFTFTGLIDSPENEKLRLFVCDLSK